MDIHTHIYIYIYKYIYLFNKSSGLKRMIGRTYSGVSVLIQANHIDSSSEKSSKIKLTSEKSNKLKTHASWWELKYAESWASHMTHLYYLLLTEEVYTNHDSNLQV